MKENVNFDIDQARGNLRHAIESTPHRVTLKSLSLALGRNPAYLHQYLYRGSPRTLPEEVRLHLAHLLGVNERLLRPQGQGGVKDGHNIAISYLDHPSQDGLAVTPWFIPQDFMNGMGSRQWNGLRLARVGPHSSPVFQPRDVVMIDLMDRNPLKAGYFALDMKDHLRIRHLEQISPTDLRVRVTNGDSSGYDSTLDPAVLVGRVIFHAQMFPDFGKVSP